MKTSSIIPVLALLASASALPADVRERGLFPFSLPSFALPTLPAFPGFPLPTHATTPAAAPPAASTPAAHAPSTTTAPAVSTPPPSTGGTSSGLTGGNTENGVVNGECKELTIIFARGTTESGNVGTVAGPPMFSALRSSLGAGKVTVQGVDYPASAAGNANLGADGGPTMANLVKQALSQCPSTKIALSGYSQGAMVVHNAVTAQGVSPSQIAAVVLFGDPFNGQSVGGVPSSELLEFCASGDQVCNGSGSFAITAAHLTYGNNAQQAASFIIKTAGVS